MLRPQLPAAEGTRLQLYLMDSIRCSKVARQNACYAELLLSHMLLMSMQLAFLYKMVKTYSLLHRAETVCFQTCSQLLFHFRNNRRSFICQRRIHLHQGGSCGNHQWLAKLGIVMLSIHVSFKMLFETTGKIDIHQCAGFNKRQNMMRKKIHAKRVEPRCC